MSAELATLRVGAVTRFEQRPGFPGWAGFAPVIRPLSLHDVIKALHIVNGGEEDEDATLSLEDFLDSVPACLERGSAWYGVYLCPGGADSSEVAHFGTLIATTKASIGSGNTVEIGPYYGIQDFGEWMYAAIAEDTVKYFPSLSVLVSVDDTDRLLRKLMCASELFTPVDVPARLWTVGEQTFDLGEDWFHYKKSAPLKSQEPSCADRTCR